MTRLDDMLTRYGECVTKTRAAAIIGRTARTVDRMCEDGRLRTVCQGTMVCVRSIAEYIEAPAAHDEETRHQRRMKKRGISCEYHV